MKTIIKSTQFKKDYKRYRNRKDKLKALYENILVPLEQTGCVPRKYYPHKLHGFYEGCMECHIEDDFLLIWIDEERNIIELVRLGSHSELFGK